MPWLVEHLFPPWIQPSHLFTQAVCGYGSQEALALRPAREGELYFPEDREVNLVELALATNIPKGCAETAVRGDRRGCLLYTSPSPRDRTRSRMPSSA